MLRPGPSSWGRAVGPRRLGQGPGVQGPFGSIPSLPPCLFNPKLRPNSLKDPNAMCVYIYILHNMYTCIYIYICICVYIYIYVYKIRCIVCISFCLYEEEAEKAPSFLFEGAAGLGSPHFPGGALHPLAGLGIGGSWFLDVGPEMYGGA